MENYKNQVALLLTVIPEIEREEVFALHGGTAINLFERDMPRLSVDIDLTYIPIQNRDETFKNINIALDRVRKQIEELGLDIKVVHKEEQLKLLVSNGKGIIKVEVNQGMRGVIGKVIKKQLCERTQEDFEAFCSINVVSLGQLYGGKLCAALDRQHPRDLFDIKYLLDNEGITEEIKIGFLYALLSSKRPINEVLFPHFLDQQEAFLNQFEGMAAEVFTYEDFVVTRERMVKGLQQSLSDIDKQFILSVENVTPQWDVYDFKDYPSVQWKLHNLERLKKMNSGKHLEGVKHLKKLLDNI